MDSLRSSMNEKFHGMEYIHILAETAVLDPRFKKLAFSDARAIDEALQRITSQQRRTVQAVSWLRHQGNRKHKEQKEQKHQQC